MDVKMSMPLMSALRAAQAGGAAGVGAAGLGAAVGKGAAGAVGKADGGFGRALDDALKSVSRTQAEAGRLQRAFQTGAEGVTLEDTMVAMQKAQIAFQGATTVRNRLVSAYTDIMNMSV